LAKKEKGFLETVNQTPIDIGLMKRMLTHVDEMSDEQRSDMAGRSIGLIQFLEAEGISADAMKRAHTLMGFEFRMEALSRLRDRSEYRAWSLQLGKTKGDPDLINEVMIETAAVHPLIRVDDQPAFEPDSFFREALARAEAGGHA